MKELVIKGRGPNGFQRGAFMDKYDTRTHSRGLYRKSKNLLVARVPRSRTGTKDSHSIQRAFRRRSPSPRRTSCRDHSKRTGTRSPSSESRSTSADSHSTRSSSSSPSSTRRNRRADHKRHDSYKTRSLSPKPASVPLKSTASSPPPGILHLLHLAVNTQPAGFNSLEDEKKKTEQMLIELEKGTQTKLAIQLELQRREIEEAKKELEKTDRRA